MKFRRIIKNAILLLVVFLFILSFFTLSPQWCLSKERMWRAEEMDMVLYVDDEYETKFYECFGLSDRNELKEHIKGEVRINGKIQEFTFKGEDHFEWIEFGNNYDTDNGGWIVAGEFGLVLNPKIIKFSVVSIDGDTFPADINKLTFSPVEDNAINL